MSKLMKIHFRWGRVSRIWRNFLLAVVATLSVLSISAQQAVVSNISGALTSSSSTLPYSFGNAIAAPSNAALNLGSSQPFADCISTGNCVVVDSFLSNGGQRFAYATSSSSSVTSVTQIPLPADASTSSQNVAISALKCLSKGCVVLGTYVNASGSVALFVSTGTGTTPSTLTWSSTAINSGSASPSIFSQLGCSSLGNCVVGGDVLGSNTANRGSAYVIAEANGSWQSVQSAPTPANAVPSTYNLACATDGSICGLVQIAFGDTSANINNTYVEASTFKPGSNWSTTTSLATGNDTQIGYGEVALSCTAGQCEAAYASNHSSVNVVNFTASTPSTITLSAPGTMSVIANEKNNTLYCDSSGNCQIALQFEGFNSSNGNFYNAYYMATIASGASNPVLSQISLPSGAASTNGDSLLTLTCKDYQDCTYVGQTSGNAFTFDVKAGVAGTASFVSLPVDAASSTETPSKLSASCYAFDACTVTGLYLNSQNQTVPFFDTIDAGTLSSFAVVLPPTSSLPQLSSAFTKVQCTSTEQTMLRLQREENYAKCAILFPT